MAGRYASRIPDQSGGHQGVNPHAGCHLACRGAEDESVQERGNQCACDGANPEDPVIRPHSGYCRGSEGPGRVDAACAHLMA